MRTISLILTLILISGIAGAAVPSWVQPGMTASYTVDAASIRNGQPYNVVETIWILQVDSVTQNSVTGTVQDYNPYTGQAKTDQATCNEGSTPCLGRFWLDPKNPTASIKGEMGVTYRVAGKQSYELLGRTWDATLLQYKNAQQGIDFHLYYDTETGLILAYVIKYPNQQVMVTLNSIYQDASGLDMSVDPVERY